MRFIRAGGLFIKEKKWQNFIFVPYLLLAITCSYTFLTGESFNLDINKRNFETQFASFHYSADWIAEETITIRKASRNSSSILRSGLIRIFLYLGILMTSVYLTGTCIQQIKTNKTSNFKNYILLKLRI